jgi:hypothetical protein
MPAGDNNSPLITALAALVELDPERGGMVLRKAIASLVADDSRSPGRISIKDVDGWARIRTRLRQAMADDKLTARRLGEQLELSESAIDKCAAPNGWVPSAAIVAKVEAWLISRADKAVTQTADSPVKTPASTTTGHARAGKLSPDQCSALIGRLNLAESERLIREEFGLTREVLDKAAAGQAVPREAAERIVARLAG